MPRGEQPQGGSEESKSTFSKGTKIPDVLIFSGTGFVTAGIETKNPYLLGVGFLLADKGMEMSYNNSEKAIKETEAKVNTLKNTFPEDPETEDPEKRSITNASNDFVKDHRRELILSTVLNIIGGASASHGVTNLIIKNSIYMPLGYIALGLAFTEYGSRILNSHIEGADKNIDAANLYIRRNNPPNNDG
jgi:hypothetical protein